MSEDTIIKHCAPTLAGLKTGSLFTVPCSSEKELEKDLRSFNETLNGKGLKVIRLRTRDGKALIYVYRPGKLQRDLSRADARAILKDCGYTEELPEHCISRLMDRICLCAEFPHEIGLFLGYPPEDVRGFIAQNGKGCKTCGLWKVYGDPEEAQKQFDRFRKCTCVYRRCLRRGVPLQKLAVKKN